MKATKILKATLHKLGIDNNDDWKAAGIEKVTHIDQDMIVNFLMTDGSTKKAKYPETTLTTIDDVDIIISIATANNIVNGNTQHIDINLTGCTMNDTTSYSSDTNIATVSQTGTGSSGTINVAALTPGEVTITVTHHDGESESFTINVTNMIII